MPDDTPIIKKVEEEREEEKRIQKRKDELLSQVEKWRDDGWKVDDLVDSIEEDLEEGEEKFDRYEKNIGKLKNLRNEYESLDKDEIEFDDFEIKSKLDDPKAVDEVKKSIEELKDKVKTNKQKKELLKKVDRWDRDGWEVRELRKTIKDYPKNGKEMFEDYEKKIERMKKVKKKYHDLDKSGFQSYLSQIVEKLSDPKKVNEVEKKVNELHTMIKEKRKKKKKKLLQKVKVWKDEGLEVEKLEKKIKKDPKKGEKYYFKYKDLIRRLKDLNDRYDQIKDSKFDVFEGHDLERYLNDPTKADKIEKEIEKFEEKIREKKEKERKRRIKRNKEKTKRWAKKNIDTIKNELKNYKPDYSPLGRYFDSEEWTLEEGELKLKGYYKGGMFKDEKLEIIVKFVPIKFIKNDIRDVESHSENSDSFTSILYLVPKSNPSLKRFFKNYKNRFCSVYLLSPNGDLVYNDNDWKTRMFSNWFDSEKEPVSLLDILYGLSDQDNIFDKRVLVNKLNLSLDDGEKILEDLQRKGKVYVLHDVKRNLKRYTFRKEHKLKGKGISS